MLTRINITMASILGKPRPRGRLVETRALYLGHHSTIFLSPTMLPLANPSPSPTGKTISSSSFFIAAFYAGLFFRLSRFPRIPVSATWKTLSDFTSLNHWTVRDYYRLVDSVNSLEDKMQLLTDEQLAEKTEEFRRRLKEGETLAEIQSEAFAVVREAARRKLGMRHFDVQLIGGAMFHDGSIAEMKTGEGKTLVSTLAA